MNFDRSIRWIEEYKRCGALWIHDGNPRRPHALLTSGKHSDGFFNSGLVTEDPKLIIDASFDLVGAVTEQIPEHILTGAISYVVGPSMGAIVLAHCLAHAVNAVPYNTRRCKASFTEKVDADGNMVLKRTSFHEGDNEVLVVEDVLTTGGSVERTIDAVTQAGGRVAPVVAVLVNRSGLTEVKGGRKIVALIDRCMPMWEADACPLCKQGSEAIRPKGSENWARLNASY